MRSIDSSLEALTLLCQQLEELQVQHEERLRTRHERFNIFTTLLSAHDEVRLHTRFLHALLDPKGTHDCGNLFLKEFFETLKDQPPTPHSNSSIPNPNVDFASEPSGEFWVGKEVVNFHPLIA